MKSNDPSVAEDHSTNRSRNGRRRSDGHRPPPDREPADAQLGDLLTALSAAANGDFSVRVAVDGYSGVMRQIAQKFNRMAELNEALTDEITRVERVVRREGRMTETASLRGVTGGWSQIVSSVNSLISGLVQPSTEVARVISAVADGDLTQKMAMELDGQPVKGEFLRIGRTVNAMVDQLSSFAAEVTRVAKEVGTDGKLGGQARVKGVSGIWKDLTDNVNVLASNLTAQVRSIAKVTTAVANGDLSQKLIGVEAKGEIAALADTINGMTDTLGIFADQVSTVAREVGIEGMLGGQAKVPGAAGTWRRLTDNVNQLAGNLTAQVRAISEVASAVTKGDLTRSIQIEAAGEVAALSDTINQMIGNLRETTRKNTEQDWLKTNLARFSSMMQGQKDLDTVSSLIMSELTPLVSAHHGAFFLMDSDGESPMLKLTATYAYRQRKGVPNRFWLGEGLIGQCALEKKSILLTKVPSDYIQISSGLGEAPPLNIIVLPILFEGNVRAVIELASFHPFSEIHQIFLDQLSESIGVVLNVMIANQRTEQLLEQSQKLTQELQTQSSELTDRQQALKLTNSALERQALELEEKARLLEQQNVKVEEKNREVEQARKSLEEKAEQMALLSKYKSEFLANMSHELRTPLNSLLVLAKVLCENKNGTLTEKDLEYARTIHGSGIDLLHLINEVLDLSKMEAGKIHLEYRDASLADIAESLAKSFKAVGSGERTWLRGRAISRSARDNHDGSAQQRLDQILRNLLDNAFKFTESGSVTLRITRAEATDPEGATLAGGTGAIAFSVADTGIGIEADKQQIIFEAFQQADGRTSRNYGGTGLGLSISRDACACPGRKNPRTKQDRRGQHIYLVLARAVASATVDR